MATPMALPTMLENSMTDMPVGINSLLKKTFVATTGC